MSTAVIARQTTAYAWYVAALMGLAYLLNIVDRFLLAVVYEDLRQQIPLTDQQYSILQGPAFAFVFVIASLPMGWLADIWSRRSLITLGLLVWSLATGACGLADSYQDLLIAKMFVGVGEATLMPCALSLITAYFSRDKLSRGMSVYSMGGSMGRFTAFAGGGWLLHRLTQEGLVQIPGLGSMQPWQAVFLAAALAGVGVAVLLFSTLREPIRAQRPTAAGSLRLAWRHFLGQPQAYLAVFVPFSMAAAITMQLAAFIISLLVREHGLDAGPASQYVAFASLPGALLGHLFGGWLNDWLAARGVKGPQPLVLAGLLALVMLAMPFLLLTDSIAVAIGVYAVIYWLVCVPGPTGPAGVQLITPDAVRGLMSSLFLMFYIVLGTGLGPLAAGVINTQLLKNQLGLSILVGTTVFGTIGLASAVWWNRSFRAAVLAEERKGADT